MSLDQLYDMRRAQGVRVANASRGKKDRELLLYLQIEQEIAALERRQEPRP